MLSSLARPPPPRTKTRHLAALVLDSGLSTAEFRPPGGGAGPFRFLNRLPPAPARSSLAPPPHRHLGQDETFRVVAGAARFTLGGGGGAERVAGAGEVVVVPRRAAHAFCNASRAADLVVEFYLDPAAAAAGGADEVYFRNVWSYRDDCRKAGVAVSVFQMLLFMNRGGVVKVLPGPEIVSLCLGLVLNFVGGVVIGKMLLGYRDSYPEYYHSASS